jgi:heme o synthase
MTWDAELAPEPYYPRSLGRTLVAYIELMKPELTSLSVLTVMAGFYMAKIGSWGGADYISFINVVIGTLLVGGGAGALNQCVERGFDAQMKRTEHRPLPSGRIAPDFALAFGICISVIGILLLYFFVNPLTGFLAVLTSSSYLFLYTPLKRITPMATIFGGIPGALPPVMGWTAARNDVSIEAWLLFAILFLWQMPHFYSLAWLYKKDYARAGYKMLTVLDDEGIKTGQQMLFNCAFLIPVSMMPALFHLSGHLYFWTSFVLGASFLTFALFFTLSTFQRKEHQSVRTNNYARKLFIASLLYLPALFVLMAVDKVRL